MSDIKAEINAKTEEIEKIIREYLPKEDGYQKTVIEAMNYSILSGGKRLRPMLMWETYKMLGGEGNTVKPFMAALEMIHTYSLIHDDLPCMDDDEYRRGRKTTHVVYGEAMAVLAGDALLNFAFETAAKSFGLVDEKDAVAVMRLAKALRILGMKAGIYGMVGGQCVDVEAEKEEKKISGEELLFIHKNKTAALIEASMMIGAVLAGADGETVKTLEKCAENVGIAFQIQDDILDVIGTLEELGKPIGSDAKNNKQTYVTIYGMDKAERDVTMLSEEAIACIEAVDTANRGDFLKRLIISLIHRTR
ncbi:MAG: polyprenyl synthetase family protein [Lachnospiraceae bacterium]|nr:polyprenyl synthetase family protein [Lachnospiraceae bacterium]MBR4993246.1 polyprenyl synthetase family protein [Lachnospiraceae bacterium]